MVTAGWNQKYSLLQIVWKIFLFYERSRFSLFFFSHWGSRFPRMNLARAIFLLFCFYSSLSVSIYFHSYSWLLRSFLSFASSNSFIFLYFFHFFSDSLIPFSTFSFCFYSPLQHLYLNFSPFFVCLSSFFTSFRQFSRPTKEAEKRSLRIDEPLYTRARRFAQEVVRRTTRLSE